jgi:hypothetical protein
MHPSPSRDTRRPPSDVVLIVVAPFLVGPAGAVVLTVAVLPGIGGGEHAVGMAPARPRTDDLEVAVPGGWGGDGRQEPELDRAIRWPSALSLSGADI